jgi:hypothetical protein
MADAFLQLPSEERREALEVAASLSGRPAHLLEKDIWVVWSLDALFASPLGAKLVFKGGTSLSKAYRVIRRFSEDVDLTYDIRAIAPDLVGDTEDALPTTRSAGKTLDERNSKAVAAMGRGAGLADDHGASRRHAGASRGHGRRGQDFRHLRRDHGGNGLCPAGRDA